MKYAINDNSIFLVANMYNRYWDEQIESGFTRDDIRHKCQAIFDVLMLLEVRMHFDTTQHIVIDYEKMEEVQ